MQDFTPLLSATEAHALWQRDPEHVRFVDCRFALQDVTQGPAAFAQGHLPEAVYAHLDHDLSGPIVPGRTGRHPLPEIAVFEARLQAWGIHHDTRVIAYDDASGVFASRLWWMLRWLGHNQNYVLNGGLAAWTRQGFPLTQDVAEPQPGNFRATADPALVVEAADILDALGSTALVLVDARDPERYAGEQEPLDARAGHIPGALNHPYQHNLNDDSTFLPPQETAAVLCNIWGTPAMTDTVMYCGSGVSACHTVLAAVHAGLGMPRLYPGSWSEWITNPERPVALGPAP